MRQAVDAEITLGELHAVYMADFAGQIEDDIRFPNLIRGSVGVGNVEIKDCAVVGDRLDVVPVGAAARFAGIDDGNPRARLHQLNGKIAADKAEPPGNNGPLACIGLMHVSPRS